MHPNVEKLSLRMVAGAGLLFVCFSHGQAQQVSEGGGQPPMATAQAVSHLSIAPGDLVVVNVLNTPELSGTFRVSPQGTISLSQGGDVTVAGMETLQAEQQIEKKLRDSEIMLDPHVTVLVQEYSSEGVNVLGAVNKPGTYTLLGEHSLYGALAAAGGTGPDLGQTITVSHQDDPTSKEVIDVSSPNYSERMGATTVNPGDTVVVSSGHLIYVYGDVTHPGAFSMGTRNLNVLEALALAEGTDKIAAKNKGRILRQTPTGLQTIPIDLKRIARNEDPDPILQASDIVIVPRSLAKALFFQALPGITSSATGAGVTAAIIR